MIYLSFLLSVKNTRSSLAQLVKCTLYELQFGMRGHAFIEIQLLHSLIVLHRVYKNIFNSEMNELSASNLIELL